MAPFPSRPAPPPAAQAPRQDPGCVGTGGCGHWGQEQGLQTGATPAWPNPRCPRGPAQHPLTGGRTRGASARTGMAVCLGRGRRGPGLLWPGSDRHSRGAPAPCRGGGLRANPDSQLRGPALGPGFSRTTATPLPGARASGPRCSRCPPAAAAPAPSSAARTRTPATAPGAGRRRVMRAAGAPQRPARTAAAGAQTPEARGGGRTCPCETPPPPPRPQAAPTEDAVCHFPHRPVTPCSACGGFWAGRARTATAVTTEARRAPPEPRPPAGSVRS